MEAAENINREKPRILIVDDVSMNVEILENIIVHEGYEALPALSVQEAIGIMQETMPSLILSDISMPEVDGLEFCRMIKSNPKTREIPFVFISVLDTGEEKQRAFRAGAEDYIPKPFDAIEVIMRVNNHLNSYRLRQEMAHYNHMMHRLVEDQKKQIEKGQENMLFALEKMTKRKDADVSSHLENVGYNSRLLAQGLQLLPAYENRISDEFVETIEVSARLHDIGGIVIPDDIYLPEKRTKGQEAEYIRLHTTEGAEILEEISNGQADSRFLSMAIRIARFHHAHWDGSGFPAICQEEIPLEARITAVTNKFDVLTRRGDCSEEGFVEQCIGLIDSKSGINYDPDIVRVFDKIWKQMKFG